MQKLIEFCTSVYMLYIICGCWLINYIYMTTKNKQLMRRCDELQKEKVNDEKIIESQSSEIKLLKSLEKEV